MAALGPSALSETMCPATTCLSKMPYLYSKPKGNMCRHPPMSMGTHPSCTAWGTK